MSRSSTVAAAGLFVGVLVACNSPGSSPAPIATAALGSPIAPDSTASTSPPGSPAPSATSSAATLPAPTVAPTPQAESISSLVAATQAKMKAGKVPATDTSAVLAAVERAFADPRLPDWQPRDYQQPIKGILAKHLAPTGCPGRINRPSDEAYTRCEYAGLILYKAYQTFQTPELLDAFTTFLAFVATRKDMQAHYPADGATSLAQDFLETLATCKIGMGQVDWCGQDWSIRD